MLSLMLLRVIHMDLISRHIFSNNWYTIKNMKLISFDIQTAFFTSGLVFTDKLSVSSQLIKDTDTIFDGDPIILPPAVQCSSGVSTDNIKE